MAANTANGMREVIAAQSAITWIDGRRGDLRYRGYPIGELAERCSYERVAYLLWHGELPTADAARDLSRSLRALRLERDDLTDLLASVPTSAHPLDVLRYVVSWDALRNPLTLGNSAEANNAKAREFTAWFPIIVAAFHRLRQGLEPVAPRPDLDTSANFLFMLHGAEPAEVAVRTLDTSLILHADHELNASTFAARVTIATQSNLHAAVASALGALAGPRHGGASEQVIRMLETIETPERVERYVSEELAARRRIMGFGHEVYKTTDPRSRHLRAMTGKMLEGTPRQTWVPILDELGAVMERTLNLYPNVDLYAAVVNHELGIDPAFYTSIFACSRIVGWTAHAIEQLDGRLIRPSAEYIGQPPRGLREQVPVEG
ncbi:MAG: citrate synthase [Chloroflexota bacterium]|nr:citrate synthase [Chloroflexota bacterium]